MKLDPARSHLTIFTEAEGLFSALAHDLELRAEELEGEASERDAEVRLRPESIRVRGVTKRGKLDLDVLSAADRASIERQIREELFPVPRIVARGKLAAKRATIELTARAALPSSRVTCEVAVTEDAAVKRARGSVEVSLAALGAPPVKGPMGAFRVKDRVRIEFDLVFA